MALLQWMEIIFDVANVLQNSPNLRKKTMKRQHMKIKKKENRQKVRRNSHLTNNT